jgi:thiol-disulfide isomerase/thioredoxin
MNKHLKALMIVGGITVLILVVTVLYWQRTQGIIDHSAELAKASVEINQELPNFEAKTLNGHDIKLSQFKGKVVVVNFWASWCGPCVEEVPSLIQILKDFPNDLELVAISGDSSQEDIDSFMKSFPEMRTLPNIHVVWDADKRLSQQYQIYRLPESFLLNKELKLVKTISGTIDWHTEDAITFIKQLVHPKQETMPASSPAAAGTQDKDLINKGS